MSFKILDNAGKSLKEKTLYVSRSNDIYYIIIKKTTYQIISIETGQIRSYFITHDQLMFDKIIFEK